MHDRREGVVTLIPASERSCAHARRALSLLLDDEGGPTDVRALAVHLGTCESCRLFAARAAAVTRALRTGVDETRRLAPTWTEGGRS
jgi:predicted anti-sigma-YlaC factor YlaD